MIDLTDGERATLESGHCPVCAKRGFVVGPQGGAATNIECADLECRARFNVVFFSGQVLHAQTIEREGEGGLPWPSAPHRGTFS